MTDVKTDIIFESKIIPSWAKDAGLKRCFIYHGPSMEPTFQPGCLLYVRPDINVICPGDVIVFTDSFKNQFTVHRVVSSSDNGVITRGDNNSRNDTLSVTPEHIIGRVEMMEVRDLVTPVKGGNTGLSKAKLRWGLKRADRLIRRVLIWPYRTIGSSAFIQKLLRKFLSGKLMTIRLETPEGPLYKTTYKGRTVARWWPDTNRFHGKKPFELLLKNNRRNET